MYPMNMTNTAAGGYAVANDEAEHAALSAAGYEPKHVPAPPPPAPAPVGRMKMHSPAASLV